MNWNHEKLVPVPPHSFPDKKNNRYTPKWLVESLMFTMRNCMIRRLNHLLKLRNIFAFILILLCGAFNMSFAKLFMKGFVFYSDSSFKLKPSAVIDRSFCFRRNHDSQTVKNDMEDAVGIRWVDYKGKHQRDWMTWMKWSPNFPPGHSDSCILSGEFFPPPVR